MTELVNEEMSHFKMVYDKIIDRGWILGRDRKDEYVLKCYISFFLKAEVEPRN